MLEAALVMPLLLSVSFGCVEYAHFFYIKHMLQGAAREGCRAAIVTSGTKTDVDNAITNSLTAASLQNSGYTTTIKKNGTTVTTLTGAATGDTISVQVECNWGTVGVRPLGLISTSKQVVGVTVMRRE